MWRRYLFVLTRDFDAFEVRHAVYEGIVTVQWTAALIHAWLAIVTWRIRDRATLAPNQPFQR